MTAIATATAEDLPEDLKEQLALILQGTLESAAYREAFTKLTPTEQHAVLWVRAQMQRMARIFPDVGLYPVPNLHLALAYFLGGQHHAAQHPPIDILAWLKHEPNPSFSDCFRYEVEIGLIRAAKEFKRLLNENFPEPPHVE